jgi:hypothetical protein
MALRECYPKLETLNKFEAMEKNTSPSPEDHFERLSDEEDHRIKALRQVIQEGIDSSVAVNFDPVKYLQRLKSERKAKLI